MQAKPQEESGCSSCSLLSHTDACVRAQIVKKVDMESARGRKKRNPLTDLRREVAIMRTLRHKNIVALQVHVTTGHEFPPKGLKAPWPYTERGQALCTRGTHPGSYFWKGRHLESDKALRNDTSCHPG